MGAGLPMEPGHIFIHGKVHSVATSSVWPKHSRISSPVSSFQRLNTSGLSGSPAVEQAFRLLRS